MTGPLPHKNLAFAMVVFDVFAKETNDVRWDPSSKTRQPSTYSCVHQKEQHLCSIGVRLPSNRMRSDIQQTDVGKRESAYEKDPTSPKPSSTQPFGSREGHNQCKSQTAGCVAHGRSPQPV